MFRVGRVALGGAPGSWRPVLPAPRRHGARFCDGIRLLYRGGNSTACRTMSRASSLSAAHARRIEGSPSSAISLRTWSQADLIMSSSVAHIGVALFVFIALGFVVCDLFTTFAASSGKPGKGRARQCLFNALATLWNYALTSIVKRIFQILIISLTDIIRKICRGFSYSLFPLQS